MGLLVNFNVESFLNFFFATYFPSLRLCVIYFSCAHTVTMNPDMYNTQTDSAIKEHDNVRHLLTKYDFYKGIKG